MELYVITKTLHVPFGITLRGELADRRANTFFNDEFNTITNEWEKIERQLGDGDYPTFGDAKITDANRNKLYKLGTVIRPLNAKLYPLK